MRLCFEDIIKNINYDNLEQYKRKEIYEQYLYSSEGIFKILDKTINKMDIYDSVYNNITINNINFIIDNSSIKYIFYDKIPYDHKMVKKTLLTYSLSEKSKNILIIEKTNNIVTDMYFKTFDYPDQISVKEDISTLISLLN